MDKKKLDYGVEIKVLDDFPDDINRRKGRGLAPNSVKIVKALNDLEYGKVLEIANYSGGGLRSLLMNWIDRGYIRDEFMFKAKNNKVYIWKIKHVKSKKPYLCIFIIRFPELLKLFIAFFTDFYFHFPLSFYFPSLHYTSDIILVIHTHIYSYSF